MTVICNDQPVIDRIDHRSQPGLLFRNGKEVCILFLFKPSCFADIPASFRCMLNQPFKFMVFKWFF